MFCINDVCWKIKFVEPNDNELIRLDGSYSVACTDYDDKTVYIANNIRGKFLEKVITHEICHCLIFSLGIQMDLWQEEKLADFLATYAKDIIKIVNELLY